MPIYVYGCRECGSEREILMRMSDEGPDSCPECGASGTMEKRLTTAGIALKGSGFYATDFKDRPKPPCQGGDGPCPSGGCGGG